MKRSGPIKRSRTKPRRTTSPRCKTQRCGKPAKVCGYCISHAMRSADTLFSLWVRNRDGGCTAAGMFGLACSGPLAAAHIVGRRNYAVRYDPENCHALCNNAHHIAVDQHGREGHKAAWATRVLGAERYSDLLERALSPADRRDSIEQALERLETA